MTEKPLLLTFLCIRFCFETTLVFHHFSWKIKHYLWCHPQDPSPPAPPSNICNQLCKTTQVLGQKGMNSPEFSSTKIGTAKIWPTRSHTQGMEDWAGFDELRLDRPEIDQMALRLKAKQEKCLIFAVGSKDPIFWASALTLNSLVSNLIYWWLIRCVLCSQGYCKRTSQGYWKRKRIQAKQTWLCVAITYFHFSSQKFLKSSVPLFGPLSPNKY